eukprot:948871-Prorocentrum_minimum.AAC.3
MRCRRRQILRMTDLARRTCSYTDLLSGRRFVPDFEEGFVLFAPRREAQVWAACRWRAASWRCGGGRVWYAGWLPQASSLGWGGRERAGEAAGEGRDIVLSGGASRWGGKNMADGGGADAGRCGLTFKQEGELLLWLAL